MSSSDSLTPKTHPRIKHLWNMAILRSYDTSLFWCLRAICLELASRTCNICGFIKAKFHISDSKLVQSWLQTGSKPNSITLSGSKPYTSFRLVSKSVTLNDLERRNGPYFPLVHRIFVYDVVVKQLLGLPRFHNLLLIVYDHTKMICAIIQRLFEQNKLITRFDGRRCIDDWLCT